MPRRFVRRFYNSRSRVVTMTAYEAYEGPERERPFFCINHDGCHLMPIKSGYADIVVAAFPEEGSIEAAVEPGVWSIVFHKDEGNVETDQWKEVS